jgi:hypothetical protein
MANKYNPFGKREYVPSVFQIRCPCGNIATIRTKENVHTEPCWKCTRQFKVVLGMGKNNYSCYIIEPGKREERISPISVIQ